MQDAFQQPSSSDDNGQTESNYADPSVGFGTSFQAGMLNELLRKQLSPDLPSSQHQTETVTETVADIAKPETLADFHSLLVNELLTNHQFERKKVHQLLSDVYHQQQSIYQDIDMPADWRKQQFIGPSGLVMSPDNCLTTILDDIRVRGFIRGVDAAIKSKCEQIKDRPLHVVYPACGPFAPLLMPLIAYYQQRGLYSAQQLQVTLIDIQPGAVETLNTLIEKLDIEDFVAEVHCGDVLKYHPDGQMIDLLVLEAMQHGFSREGHMSFARHLQQFMHDSSDLLPRRVCVAAKIVDPNVEYVEQWREATQVSFDDCQQSILQQRIDMGVVMELTAQSLSQMKAVHVDEHTTLLECNTLEIPQLDGANEPTVILTTEVEIWGDEVVREYDSGITHPLPDQNICINFTPAQQRPGDLLVKSGEQLKFYYRLNGLPGFLPMNVG